MSSSAMHNEIMEAGGKDRAPILVSGPYEYQLVTYPEVLATNTSLVQPEGTKMETYFTDSDKKKKMIDAEAEAVHIILTGIGENINKQDVETNLFWAFGKFSSREGEPLESYYSRSYKLINELVRNKCVILPHQVNVQFLLQLQPEWQRFVTIVKQGQDLKTVSYHKLFEILKQHQNKVNEIQAERLARNANLIAVYYT
ncbi:hypothetical protein Tco_0863078 [Tanacetum coccineum]